MSVQINRTLIMDANNYKTIKKPHVWALIGGRHSVYLWDSAPLKLLNNFQNPISYFVKKDFNPS